MSSSPSDPSAQSKDTIEDVISSHGGSIPPVEETPEVVARLDKLEVLIEEMGRTSELVASFSDYIADLKGDLRALRRTRFWMLIFAIAFVIGIDAAVMIMIFHHGQWFALQETTFKSVTFVSTITASVVLISIMLKGAFHSLAERNKADDGLPPHLKEGMDLIKMLSGK